MIVGDGPERDRLERLVKSLGLLRRVRFLGRVGPSEARAVMAECDCVVLNSTYEGLPHVALEALALGQYVIATSVGGMAEVVENGGDLMPISPNDEAALCRALGEVVSTLKSSETSVRNAPKPEPCYSMLRETVEILERQMRGRVRSPTRPASGATGSQPHELQTGDSSDAF